VTDAPLGLLRLEQEEQNRRVGLGALVPEHRRHFPVEGLLRQSTELGRRHLAHHFLLELLDPELEESVRRGCGYLDTG
jgi:hypothetical protein